MRMAMSHGQMSMPMTVGLALRGVRVVLMLVMLVVAMTMLVGHGLVIVQVVMLLGQVEPESESHQARGDQQFCREWLVQDEDSHNGADEGCERKVGSRPRGAEMAQRQDEQREADAVTQKTDDASSTDQPG